MAADLLNRSALRWFRPELPRNLWNFGKKPARWPDIMSSSPLFSYTSPEVPSFLTSLCPLARWAEPQSYNSFKFNMLRNWVLLSFFGHGRSQVQSFPRQRESTPPAIENAPPTDWIPAFAGMTSVSNEIAFQMTPAPEIGWGQGSHLKSWLTPCIFNNISGMNGGLACGTGWLSPKCFYRARA